MRKGGTKMKVKIKDNCGNTITVKDNVKEIGANMFGNTQLVFENGKHLTLQKHILKVERQN